MHFLNGRLWGVTVFGALLAFTLYAQSTPYELKVETGAGLVAFTFKTGSAQARAYFPDDLAPGEAFSASLEGPGNYSFEFNGQAVKANQGLVRWTVPSERNQSAKDQGEKGQNSYPLILKDAKGAEVGRASLIGKKPAAPRTLDQQFRLPQFIQAGAPAPALGPFDGDANSTQILVGGKPATVVAESRRKAIILCPEVLGPVAYSIAKGAKKQDGETRALNLDVTASGITVAGLVGLRKDIPFSRGSEYFFLRAANVNSQGVYTSSRNHNEEPLRLVFPQTPADDVALILYGPRGEHAPQLRALDFDPVPELAAFLNDPDLGGDAGYALLAIDEKRGLPVLFRSMPDTGPNIQRIGMSWFLQHYAAADTAAMIAIDTAVAHQAALRVLNRPQASRTDAQELALYTLGFTGDKTDFPLLEKNYAYRNGWPGLKRVQDASEAALARLGSREHAANIRAELELPLASASAMPSPGDAIRAGQSLQKAGFAGLPEFLPAICPHLNDPAVTDIDVTWDPKLSAMSALNAIANHTTPLATPVKKTVGEWQDYCRNIR